MTVLNGRAPRSSDLGSAAPEPGVLDCRPLYRSLAASVSVVTVAGDAGPLGMTASSVTAVSLDPPLMAVTLGPESPTLAAIRRTGWFGISVLAEDQQAIAARFAGGRPRWARFVGVSVLPGELPLLADAAARAICSVEWERPCGDRMLLLGRVREAQVSERLPLLWHRSGYHGLQPLPGTTGHG